MATERDPRPSDSARGHRRRVPPRARGGQEPERRRLARALSEARRGAREAPLRRHRVARDVPPPDGPRSRRTEVRRRRGRPRPPTRSASVRTRSSSTSRPRAAEPCTARVIARAGHLVALKVLDSRGAVDPRDVERFHREAAMLRALNLVHVVPVLDTGEEAGRFWIAMKWLEGDTFSKLREAVADKSHRAPRPPRARAARRARRAHVRARSTRYGILHRDVKPTNIMVDTTGEPMIIDFGIAHAPDLPELHGDDRPGHGNAALPRAGASGRRQPRGLAADGRLRPRPLPLRDLHGRRGLQAGNARGPLHGDPHDRPARAAEGEPAPLPRPRRGDPARDRDRRRRAAIPTWPRSRTTSSASRAARRRIR